MRGETSSFLPEILIHWLHQSLLFGTRWPPGHPRPPISWSSCSSLSTMTPTGRRTCRIVGMRESTSSTTLSITTTVHCRRICPRGLIGSFVHACPEPRRTCSKSSVLRGVECLSDGARGRRTPRHHRLCRDPAWALCGRVDHLVMVTDHFDFLHQGECEMRMKERVSTLFCPLDSRP